MAKVSVIIPIYGVEEYIERCARSLFEQSLDDIEYLFIDDCSPDKSVEVLHSVLEEYPNRKEQVHIHQMYHNSGQAAVRAWGMQNASGDYVIHCDSDDWVDREMYHSMYLSAIENGADIVVGDYCITDGISKRFEEGLRKGGNFLVDMMYSKVSWALWNKLVKRELYIDKIVFPSQNVGEDMAMVLQMALLSNRISSVKGVYYYYYYNAGSIMNRLDRGSVLNKYYQMCDNIAIVEQALDKNGLLVELRNQLDAIKFYCQILLIPVLDNNIKNEWKSKYDISYLKAVLNHNVNIRFKIRYILYKLRIYNFITGLKRCRRNIC